MKWLKNIEDLTAHIFRNKERASKRHVNRAETEKPREVFTRACQFIAHELNSFGFQYSPSQHKLKLESIDKKYNLVIRFFSNRDNVAGQYIELSAFFSIECIDLKKFSKSNPLLNYWSGKMIGRDFGTLVDKGKGSLVWNLADNEEYENAISIIPRITKERLIYLFKDIQNSELIVNEIEKDNFELDNPMTTVQYLLMVDRGDVAGEYLSTFLTRKPEKILQDYKETVEEFKSEGVPEEFIHGKGYGHEIALLENEYKLKVKVPNIT